MVSCVGIDTKKIEKWYKKDVSMTYKDFKLEFKKERRYIYLITILGIISFVYLLQSILFYNKFIILFIISLVFLLINILVIKKHQKRITKEEFSIDCYDSLENIFDKYSKRSINWLLILFLEVFMMILEFISLKVNSKPDEIIETFNKSLFLLEIVSFFFIKNTLIIYIMKKVDI